MKQIKTEGRFQITKFDSKQKEQLMKKLRCYYGDDLEKLKNFYFYFNPRTEKIFVSKIDLEKISINKITGIGLYFGTFHSNDRFRLSIEGSKFVIPKKNFIEIDFEKLKSYLTGENLFQEEVKIENLEKNCPFYIVKYKNENIGCVSLKENIFLNYIPKSRRLDFNKLF